MTLTNIDEKLKILSQLVSLGFKKEIIAYVLLRIEELDEDMGSALWNAITAENQMKENVENKENVA